MRLPGRLIRGSVRPDRASLARFVSLRWAALPIVDRRWTAPMAGAALAMGIFVGVAIGPGTQGTEGASGPVTVQVPPPSPETATNAPDGGTGGAGDAGDAGQPSGGGSGSGPTSPPSSSPPLDLGAGSTPPITTPPISPTPSIPPPSTPPLNTGGVTPQEPVETTTALAGIVVHINPHAESYAIADDGRLIAIHSHHQPNLGKSIEVEAERLPNGTYVEAGNRSENGRHGQASFGGIVSYRDPGRNIYTVSAAGVSLLVRGGANVPEVGDDVDVRVRFADNAAPLNVRPAGADGCGRPPALPKQSRKALEQVDLSVEAESTTTDVEGIVEGVCRDSDRLIVSADDLRQSGRDISLLVPDDIELGALRTGQVLRLTAEILDGGSLRLTSVAGDKAGKGAQDEDLVQP